MKNKKGELRPEDLKSKYLHERLDIREEMHSHYLDRGNRNVMGSFDLELMSKLLDDLGHFERTERK